MDTLTETEAAEVAEHVGSNDELKELVDGLLDWLRIPSISTGGGDPNEIRRAADWAVERIEDAGGTAGIIETSGNPLV
jgi:hypothetical protein